MQTTLRRPGILETEVTDIQAMLRRRHKVNYLINNQVHITEISGTRVAEMGNLDHMGRVNNREERDFSESVNKLSLKYKTSKL